MLVALCLMFKCLRLQFSVVYVFQSGLRLNRFVLFGGLSRFFYKPYNNNQLGFKNKCVFFLCVEFAVSLCPLSPR